MKNQDNLQKMRHSCSHLLAAAVLEFWPKAKPTIGPATEDGFYYDFDFGNDKISEDDLAKIESKIKEILPDWKSFKKIEVTKKQAEKEFKNNHYKLELIKEFAKEGKKLTIYQSGNFCDLCKGGHAKKPNEELKNFKLLSIAGAYWRGSEKNKMLTRIYGTCFPTKKELDHYLWQQEEAKKRDHRKLGPELEIFMFHETAPGMPYWLPKGLIIINELVNFWRVDHNQRGYQEIKSPLINKKELYLTSGHWEHYRENMFISETAEKETYVLKPMNCPNAMVVFTSRPRSYKELPLRLSDTDTLHRFERSGTLNGLLRAREFSQDDAHIFVEENQIAQEYERIFEITRRFYGIFGLQYRYRLGTRPKKFLGNKKLWNKAEKTLKDILRKRKENYSILKGDGAFYGPKIDILMNDALGREWQMGTIQLDYQIPQRFNLKYTDNKGKLRIPVVIHRVIYGSLERFVGILIEHTIGAFPIWLSPVQAWVIPIALRHIPYAQKVFKALREEGFRVEFKDENETMGKKIREGEMQKIPYLLIVGDREEKSKTVSLRQRKKGDLGTVKLVEFIARIKKEIEEKK